MIEVELFIEGGVVHDVTVPDGVRVTVRDYDVEGSDESDLETDDDGHKFYRLTFGGNAAAPASGLRAAFDAEKGPRFLVRDESGRGGSVGDLSASEVVERFGEDFDDAAEDEDRLADLVEQLGVTGEVRIDGATVVVRVS